jgi:protein-S-isoprenylcysteine O-methyltransferase Ste14
MSASASPLEVTWTTIGVIGVFFTGVLIVLSLLDRRTVQEEIDADPPRARAWGPRWWVATRDTGMWLLIAYIWSVFVGMGVIFMQFPPPPPSTEQRVASMWVGWLFISAEFVLALFQAWYLFCRNRIDAATRESS